LAPSLTRYRISDIGLFPLAQSCLSHLGRASEERSKIPVVRARTLQQCEEIVVIDGVRFVGSAANSPLPPALGWL